MSELVDNADRLTPEQRRTVIVDAVLSDGSIRIDDLADRLGVSPVTIYRDVPILEEAGMIERSKGELRRRESSTTELPPKMRRARARAEKTAIAKLASTLINSGEAVLIDDSSTALPMVPLLDSLAPLTIITNSMMIARSVSESRVNELVLIGGRYHSWADAYYGSLARRFVRGLRADVCFMSDGAIWGEGTYNPLDYVLDMKQTMIEQASRSVLIVDHSKFTRRAWQQTASLSDFDTIITDDGATPEQLDLLQASGSEVLVAKVEHFE